MACLCRTPYNPPLLIEINKKNRPRAVSGPWILLNKMLVRGKPQCLGKSQFGNGSKKGYAFEKLMFAKHDKGNAKQYRTWYFDGYSIRNAEDPQKFALSAGFDPKEDWKAIGTPVHAYFPHRYDNQKWILNSDGSLSPLHAPDRFIGYGPMKGQKEDTLQLVGYWDSHTVFFDFDGAQPHLDKSVSCITTVKETAFNNIKLAQNMSFNNEIMLPMVSITGRPAKSLAPPVNGLPSVATQPHFKINVVFTWRNAKMGMSILNRQTDEDGVPFREGRMTMSNMCNKVYVDGLFWRPADDGALALTYDTLKEGSKVTFRYCTRSKKQMWIPLETGELVPADPSKIGGRGDDVNRTDLGSLRPCSADLVLGFNGDDEYILVKRTSDLPIILDKPVEEYLDGGNVLGTLTDRVTMATSFSILWQDYFAVFWKPFDKDQRTRWDTPAAACDTAMGPAEAWK